MQVACKAEAGYVGRGMHAGGDHRLARSAVELGHRFDDWRECGIVQNADLAPRARDARAERLVRYRVSPGFAPSFRTSASGATVPKTHKPYFGSSSSMEWPPIITAPAR